MDQITPLASQTETNHFDFALTNNDVTNNYKFIKGKLILANREPDGDSVAFIADDVTHFKDVYRGYLLKPSPINGSVQLRFEGIDAPELHYGAALQPFGVEARDFLLKTILNFNATYALTAANKISTKVVSSMPETLEVFIVTNSLETHGRPISYIFLLEDTVDFVDGKTDNLDFELISKCVNYKMVESGWAYLMAYTSMPHAHMQLFKEAANKARTDKKGVWGRDSTADFKLTNATSIEGANGQLIFPKLFRRCVDFFKSTENDIKSWLRTKDTENDEVRITENTTVQFSSLIKQVNDHIYFQADTNDIIFIEK